MLIFINFFSFVFLGFIFLTYYLCISFNKRILIMYEKSFGAVLRLLLLTMYVTYYVCIYYNIMII